MKQVFPSLSAITCSASAVTSLTTDRRIKLAEEIEFVNGLIVKAPHQNAPDFVKASISLKVTDLILWLQGRSEDWVNVDVKESKGGKWYASVSTFKPKSRDEGTTKAQANKPSASVDFDDDIPF